MIMTPIPFPARLRMPRTGAGCRRRHAPSRVRVAGKFLFVGQENLRPRVTYGPFRPGADGCEFHDPQTVGRDFALMAANNINTVRTYTVPPVWLLDLALKYNLRVFVGLPWNSTSLSSMTRAASAISSSASASPSAAWPAPRLAGLQHRQRDPLAHRPVVWPPAG